MEDDGRVGMSWWEKAHKLGDSLRVSSHRPHTRKKVTKIARKKKRRTAKLSRRRNRGK